ncbi:hypothetical protein SH668x_002670 [Planctomicrobium sp. SH668]|uniref:hypothetical protein n=1 Tax=Planctomicrobium sp. SH668 TaxID=3448126 RepID=UPI003F5AFFCC
MRKHIVLCLLMTQSALALAESKPIISPPDADLIQTEELDDSSLLWGETAPETFRSVSPLFPEPSTEDEQTNPTPHSKSVTKSGPIDLRLPGSSITMNEEVVEPKPVNKFIDDHLLLWNEVPSGLEFLPKLGSDFGITTLGTRVNINTDSGLWFFGNFGWNFLSGPGTADVPPQTYDLSFEIHYARSLNRDWNVHFNITPLLATDFSGSSSDAFRLMAGGLVSYRLDDATKLVAGINYLDRPDLNFLPIAGVKWTITEDVQFDLVVPRPQIAWRYSDTESSENWLYLRGEVGGGSWGIKREGNLNDKMGYKDLRCLGGVETKSVDGQRSIFEIGYVFDRKISFDRGPGDVQPSSTFVLNWGQRF